MCAMDRSDDDVLSQSVKDVISSVKSIYHSSPVSVCVRNDQRETLYSNHSFQQLIEFFDVESERTLFKAGEIKLEYVLSQFEFDCIALGKGCVLCKDFICGEYTFQVRMESMFIPDESTCILWQINFIINLPFPGGGVIRGFLSDKTDSYDKVISIIPVKNLESLSFTLSGFTYGEAADYIGLPVSTVRKRVEKSREIINDFFVSFDDFRVYLFKTKKIFFFVDNVTNIINVKRV